MNSFVATALADRCAALRDFLQEADKDADAEEQSVMFDLAVELDRTEQTALKAAEGGEGR